MLQGMPVPLLEHVLLTPMQMGKPMLMILLSRSLNLLLSRPLDLLLRVSIPLVARTVVILQKMRAMDPVRRVHSVILEMYVRVGNARQVQKKVVLAQQSLKVAAP